LKPVIFLLQRQAVNAQAHLLIDYAPLGIEQTQSVHRMPGVYLMALTAGS
jgi:hypothetical protein